MGEFKEMGARSAHEEKEEGLLRQARGLSQARREGKVGDAEYGVKSRGLSSEIRVEHRYPTPEGGDVEKKTAEVLALAGVTEAKYREALGYLEETEPVAASDLKEMMETLIPKTAENAIRFQEQNYQDALSSVAADISAKVHKARVEGRLLTPAEEEERRRVLED